MRKSMDNLAGKEEEEDGKVNWVDLPDHLLASITDKLLFVKDYIRFGAVCRSWRSVYIDNLDRHYRLRGLPLLMVPPTKDDDNRTRRFYSISENAVIPDIKLLMPNDRYCRGSTEGWLITEDRADVGLLHPFSLAEIELPPTTALPHVNEIDYLVYLDKVILSADPSLNPNYFVMVIYAIQYGQLALFKHGDPTWTPLDSSFIDIQDIFYWRDVVYWRDRFYAVDNNGQIYACDPKHPNPQLVKVAHPPDEYDFVEKHIYLVVSDGDLLLVACQGLHFWEVFKLRWGSSPTPLTLTWTPLQNLGGQALFLGRNSSLSILAFDFSGCRPDCIYFTDRTHICQLLAVTEDDMVVFNLAKGKVIQCNYEVISNGGRFFGVPIWIQQSQPCSNNNKADSAEPPLHQQQQSCENLSFSHS